MSVLPATPVQQYCERPDPGISRSTILTGWIVMSVHILLPNLRGPDIASDRGLEPSLVVSTGQLKAVYVGA